LPATLRNDDDISLFHAIFISFFGHIFVTLFVWGFVSLILYLLLLLGVKLSLFEKPPAKTRDIEFVLVNSPEQPPINKNTKYRADRNSRAGGKHDPTKRVSEPSAPTMKSRPQPKSAPSVQQQHQVQRPQQRPEPQRSQQPKPKQPAKTAPKVTQPNRLLRD
jgi:cytoskeletal protein RodZ